MVTRPFQSSMPSALITKLAVPGPICIAVSSSADFFFFLDGDVTFDCGALSMIFLLLVAGWLAVGVGDGGIGASWSALWGVPWAGAGVPLVLLGVAGALFFFLAAIWDARSCLGKEKVEGRFGRWEVRKRRVGGEGELEGGIERRCVRGGGELKGEVGNAKLIKDRKSVV